MMGDIDAPGGERWYYTAEFKYDTIPPHDDVVFSDYILREYKFNIFDKEMKSVGSIRGKMNYRDNEVRTVMCDLTPVVTRNFFNTDDKLELIIGFAVNVKDSNNRYYSLVYSIGNQPDKDGFDEPVLEMADLVGDVVEGPADGNTDNFYITFMSDVDPDTDDDSDYWNFLIAHKAKFEIYGRATDDTSGPRKLLDFDIPLLQLPGDQENIPALISMVIDGTVYFSLSYYTEPFYNRYDDPIEGDLTQREGNSLKIDLYTPGAGNLTLSTSTTIPVEIEPMMKDGEATSLYTYYCVGDMRYRQDFLFDRPGSEPGKPDYVITRSNYLTSIDGLLKSYFVYSHGGSRLATLFEFAQSTLAIGDIPGFEPQQMFLSEDSFGYVFNFVNIYSAKTVCKIDYEYYYDDYSDPEPLTANISRTPVGDTYKYVCELRYPAVDDDENDIMRFIHINADGSFDHIDGVNMGSNVEYAQSYITTESLAPNAYTISDEPAYMMLLKRGTEKGNVEQLLVAHPISEAKPAGEAILFITPDSNGQLASIVPIFGDDGCLMIYRMNDSDLYTLDIYTLPLDAGAGVDSVDADRDSAITTDGTAIVAQGKISVYTASGALVGSGNGRFELSELGAGLYIVTSGGHACKLLVK